MCITIFEYVLTELNEHLLSENELWSIYDPGKDFKFGMDQALKRIILFHDTIIRVLLSSPKLQRNAFSQTLVGNLIMFCETDPGGIYDASYAVLHRKFPNETAWLHNLLSV